MASDKKDDAEPDCWVGFDLGGTKMLSQVYDADFKRIGRQRRKTKASQGSDAGLDRICETIAMALKDAGKSKSDIRAIGIGCPGPVDMEEGILLDPPNLNWKNVKVAKRLSDEFGCHVSVLNDVDAGVYGEGRFGAGQKARCVLGVFPGTGIGGGCVIDGDILRGSVSSCMEIGHVPVMPDGPLCGCGHRGCLEAVASRLAIAGQVAQAVFRGDAPNLVDKVGTNVADIRSGVLASAINDGDKVVEEIVRQAARHIGTAVAGFINMLSPDIIVLGGGLAEALPKLYVKEVQDAASERVMPSFKQSFKVVAAELGDDASVLGAAAWGESRKCGAKGS